MLTRVESTLPPETEGVMEAVIGAAIQVHRELGPGFLERIYRDALGLELTARHIPFEREVKISVMYQGTPIPGQQVDLIVDKQVVVELKAVVKTDPLHKAKVISYLKTTKLRAGLLINFHSRLLKEGVERIVL
jgi:GxxExxY protein